MIDFTSSLRSKKIHAIWCAKIWSGCVLNIYMLYIIVMSLSHLWNNFFLKILRSDCFINLWSNRLEDFTKSIMLIYHQFTSKIYEAITSLILKNKFLRSLQGGTLLLALLWSKKRLGRKNTKCLQRVDGMGGLVRT